MNYRFQLLLKMSKLREILDLIYDKFAVDESFDINKPGGLRMMNLRAIRITQHNNEFMFMIGIYKSEMENKPYCYHCDQLIAEKVYTSDEELEQFIRNYVPTKKEWQIMSNAIKLQAYKETYNELERKIDELDNN